MIRRRDQQRGDGSSAPTAGLSDAHSGSAEPGSAAVPLHGPPPEPARTGPRGRTVVPFLAAAVVGFLLVNRRGLLDPGVIGRDVATWSIEHLLAPLALGALVGILMPGQAVIAEVLAAAAPTFAEESPTRHAADQAARPGLLTGRPSYT